jgi:hypothetical protein
LLPLSALVDFAHLSTGRENDWRYTIFLKHDHDLVPISKLLDRVSTVAHLILWKGNARFRQVCQVFRQRNIVRNRTRKAEFYFRGDKSIGENA